MTRGANLLAPVVLGLSIAILPAESRELMYRVVIAGNIDDGFTSAEVLAGEKLVAKVYELPDGWRIDLLEANSQPFGQLTEAITEARELLSHYVNRTGVNAPAGLNAAGFSLWLMEMDDGTAMGLPIEGSEE